MTRFVINVPEDFEGIVEDIVMPVTRSLITNTGTSFPGSSSLPKNPKSKCTSLILGSSDTLRCGFSLHRPLTQCLHHDRQGKWLKLCSRTSSGDGSFGSCTFFRLPLTKFLPAQLHRHLNVFLPILLQRNILVTNPSSSDQGS